MRGIALVVSLALGLQAQAPPDAPRTGSIAGNVIVPVRLPGIAVTIAGVETKTQDLVIK